jgi:hypothetical protein
MKKAEKTIQYIVYPPDYEHWNDVDYITVDTKRKAFKIAVKLGNDTEVWQQIKQLNSHGTGSWFNTQSIWAVVCDKYFIEEWRNGNNIQRSYTAKVRNKDYKYACIFRKKRVSYKH